MLETRERPALTLMAHPVPRGSERLQDGHLLGRRGGGVKACLLAGGRLRRYADAAAEGPGRKPQPGPLRILRNRPPPVMPITCFIDAPPVVCSNRMDGRQSCGTAASRS